jgi:ATP-dependent DNA helicase RecQ
MRLPKGRAIDDKPSRQEPVDYKLFEMLKKLRLSIAARHNLPAYTVFADSTLLEMCSMLPETEEEMLRVSGVGQVKMRSYGKEFLELISKRGEINVEESPASSEYVIAASQEPVTVSVIADRLSVALIQRGMVKITPVKLNKWLIQEGYLKETPNGKVPTKKGLAIGMIETQSIRGPKYSLFSAEAQELIHGRVSDLVKFCVVG